MTTACLAGISQVASWCAGGTNFSGGVPSLTLFFAHTFASLHLSHCLNTLAADMAASNTIAGNPLLLPEILDQVLIHLGGEDLVNAILVNSNWAKIGCEHKWQFPPPATFSSLSEASMRQYARLVKRISLEGGEGRTDMADMVIQSPRQRPINLPDHQFLHRSMPYPHATVALPYMINLVMLRVKFTYHPKALFETLQLRSPMLRTLVITTGPPRSGEELDALEDIKYLSSILRECNNLRHLGLEFPWPRPALPIPLGILKEIAGMKLELFNLLTDIPSNSFRDFAGQVLTPFASLRRLCLAYIDVSDITSILHYTEMLQHLTLFVGSANRDFFSAVVSCRFIKLLDIRIHRIDPDSFDADFSALGQAVSIQVLSLIVNVITDGTNPLNTSLVIQTLSRMSSLTWIQLRLGDLYLPSEQLTSLGSTLPCLQILNAPFVLDVRALINARQGGPFFRDTVFREKPITFNGWAIMAFSSDDPTIPNGPSFDAGERIARTLFPKLRELHISAVSLPVSGSLLRGLDVPTTTVDEDYCLYLEKLATVVTCVILDQMPSLASFELREDVPLPPDEEADPNWGVEWDVLHTWKVYLYQHMVRGMQLRKERRVNGDDENGGSNERAGESGSDRSYEDSQGIASDHEE